MIKVEEIHTNIPSPFAFNLIAQGITDVMKIEDRVEFIRRMHKNVLAKIGLKKGKEDKEEYAFSYTDFWKKTKEKSFARIAQPGKSAESRRTSRQGCFSETWQKREISG